LISGFNITTIALYEVKNLWRSWFFRIFSVVSLVLLVFVNIGAFTLERLPSSFRALPSFIPYLNILLLNIVQAVIAGFMASEFMKYDRKLDTTDVIFARSMTNAEYVFGKTLGVFAVFGILNLAVLAVAFVFNVIIADMPFLPELYGLYPLLVSLPTLLFIFGLSFMVMGILQSQALTFIILLGYMASTIFFLGGKLHSLFDYLAFNLPLTYSDFVGFADFRAILLHRGIYFLLGLGFVFATVLLVKRLPQSRAMNILSALAAAACLSGALLLGRTYLAEFESGRKLREEIRTLNAREAESPRVSLQTCVLDLKHAGNDIEARAHLIFLNDTPKDIDRYVFSLNPGLEVLGVSRGGREIPFERTCHILVVHPAAPLTPGSADSLIVEYAGSIDDEACYPEIDEEMRNESFRFMFYDIGKRYGFITPRFVLLTSETLWYPVAGIPYGAAYPRLGEKDFIDFTLRVATEEGLTVLSQGAAAEGKNGVFEFKPETPLPCLSLVIGDYEKRSVRVDDTDYNLYILEGHDFFSEYFEGFGERLPELIRNIRNDYENRLGFEYPYKRLSIIETPLQFFTYPRLWTLAQDTVQPEQVLLPEKAAIMFNADFRQRKYWMERGARRGGRTMTPEEIQRSLFRSFVISTFVEQSSSFRSIRRIRGGPGGGFSLRRIAMGGLPNHYGNYSVFPLYYTYSYDFPSESWPVMTTAMELHVNNRLMSGVRRGFQFFMGLSDAERANRALMKRSLAEIIEDPETIEDTQDVIRMKSSYLFALVESMTGKEAFREFLDDLLERNRPGKVMVEELVEMMKERFGLDMSLYFDSFMYGKRLPAFVFSEVEAKEIIDGENTRYQVTFTVTNPEPVEGLVSVDFRVRGGERPPGVRRFGFPRPLSGENQRFIRLEGGETKEIGIVLDGRPAAMTIDTFISQNIPSVMEKRIDRIERDERAKPFDGERVVDTPVGAAAPGEIVVDNESPGFVIRTFERASLIRRLIKTDDGNDEYTGLRFWNPPRQWKLTPHNDFYGTYRHSAHYIRAGEGLNKVAWNAEIPAAGKYDVYYHVAKIRIPFFRPGGRGRGQETMRDFHFTVHHDDGVDEVELDVSGADEGWVLLGTYYFSEGPATVELSDESRGRMVYADAVKWVRSE